jgi:hypothetical protein
MQPSYNQNNSMKNLPEVMMTIAQVTDATPILLKVRSQALHVSSEEFDRLCKDNPDLRLEMTHEGKLIVMPPTFGDSGKKNISLSGQVRFGLGMNRQTWEKPLILRQGMISPRSAVGRCRPMYLGLSIHGWLAFR